MNSIESAQEAEDVLDDDELYSLRLSGRFTDGYTAKLILLSGRQLKRWRELMGEP